MGAGGEVLATSTPGQQPRSQFHWDTDEEPHAARKREILAKHPEIRTLMGPCPYTKYQVFFVAAVQIFLASMAPKLPWYMLIPFAHLVGGAYNCNLQLAMHEIAHNLAFKGTSATGMMSNRILSILANLPLGIPAAIAFRKYHLEHHRYQGHDVIDVDVPCEWEGWFFRDPLRKLLWCLLQPGFYALRPLFTNPKPLAPWELVNVLTQLSFDAVIFYCFGIKGLAYLVAGTLLGMGIHPTAFHFISEHCVFEEGVETYSYYGFLNHIMYNVGFHNEHHDFPNIPGSRLAQVRAIAPEFYNTLPYHTSWWKVYKDYLFRPDISPFSRVKRFPKGTSKSD